MSGCYWLSKALRTSFGHRQAAIAIINERDAELRIRAAVGFEGDTTRVEMPLDSSAACVRVIHDAQPLWISIAGRRSLTHSLRQNALAAGRAGACRCLASRRSRPKTARDAAASARLPANYWTFRTGRATRSALRWRDREAISIRFL